MFGGRGWRGRKTVGGAYPRRGWLDGTQFIVNRIVISRLGVVMAWECRGWWVVLQRRNDTRRGWRRKVLIIKYNTAVVG